MLRTLPAKSYCSLGIRSVGPLAARAPCLAPCGVGRCHLLFASTSARRRQNPPLLSEAAAATHAETAAISPSPPSAQSSAPNPPLSLLPLSVILRSLVLTAVTSSPLLLPPSLKLLARLASHPTHSALVHWLLKRTFYAQFCAGESRVEVQRTVGRLKEMGYSGVILVYARELGLEHHDAATALEGGPKEDERSLRDIEVWKEGTMETVRLASAGDFVSLKLTGAGPTAIHHLTQLLPPPPALLTALHQICTLAQTSHIRLLIDAEHSLLQPGIDAWTLSLMRRYNNNNNSNNNPQRPPSAGALVYNTYQAYLRSTPTTLAAHLAAAHSEGFTLGAKLVRGAYLASEPRRGTIIHATKAATDRAFDRLAADLIARPRASLVLATHNLASVRGAQALLAARGPGPAAAAAPAVVHAQLMGMADEVSGELLLQARAAPATAVYKYLPWGSVGECMGYLLRRAEENRDALGRTRAGRDELAREVWRRVRGLVGWLVRGG
ncbi:hypothetical protein FGG08_004047 [Glutinoglossum americanum]|uniref:Proline dehydrogenase n=1 Tax=Glutinoglossum americanum TaxID=1670608 RepID=A0A9P8L4A2_9PEZI|nr:hypothetical protein FGG08_004047 [Glutinoglossum americanum]